MQSINSKNPYFQGVIAGLPFLLVVAPFGLLFGVVATEAGLPLSQVMGFSVLVIAGASQFTALQLMTENAPIVVILVSALAVNLRMAMYSASFAPHLGPAPVWQRALIAYFNVDQTYALSIQKFEDQPKAPVRWKVLYFFGAATPICPFWYLATWAGAVLGSTIPPEFALDFAVPITFLALVAPALRTVAHLAAALTAVVLSILLAWMPYNLWLLIAAGAAMMVGAEIERRMTLSKGERV